MIALIFFGSCIIFYFAYRFYGRFLANRFDIDSERETVAHLVNDKVDFVPTHTSILFGHHFSSIAGAGPIVGPILAGLWFGWVPALLWILVGAILIGGVHDYSSLVISLRNRGRSIGDICRQNLSPFTYRIFLVFVWFTLAYVLIVFLDLTAVTFKAEGAVATASVFYICLAVIFGLITMKTKLSLKCATFIFLPLIFLGLWFGNSLPLRAEALPGLIHGDVKNTWALLLLVYCFFASITPVWILLQPRDYLSSFLLFACLVLGGLGLVLGGMSGQIAIEYPAFIGWWKNGDQQQGFIFPLLFITVACGAVSGFHSLVASGTTVKQLSNERDALPVTYGAMLIEGVLALIALAAVIMISQNPGKEPTVVFADGLGRFAASFGIPVVVGQLFGLLAVSTFLLTTLDTGTRLSRFVVEEFFGLEDRRWRYLSTLASLILPAWIVFMQIPNPAVPGAFVPAWRAIWPVFGTTNQLLAALALLIVVVWLARQGKKKLFAVIPMIFMMVTAIWSLVELIIRHFGENGQTQIAVICLVLLVLTLLVIVDTCISWKRIIPDTAEPKTSSES